METTQPKKIPDISEVKKLLPQICAEHKLNPEKDQLEIAKHLDIPVDVLKDMFIKDRQDRLIKKAELTSEELLDIDLDDPNIERKYGKGKIQVMKIMQQEAQFIRESLGKDQGYSKRTEISGKNGDAIKIQEIVFSAPVMPQPKDVDINT